MSESKILGGERTKPSINITESVQIKNSSNISAISYTDDLSLIVRFKNGGEYLYKKVPKEIYQAMSKSESAGKYLTLAVKGIYEYEKLDEKRSAELRTKQALKALLDDNAVPQELTLKDVADGLKANLPTPFVAKEGEK